MIFKIFEGHYLLHMICSADTNYIMFPIQGGRCGRIHQPFKTVQVTSGIRSESVLKVFKMCSGGGLGKEHTTVCKLAITDDHF